MRARRKSDSGYVALLTAMSMLVLLGLAAFAVDVGNWYVTGARVQRAADAGALAGVPSLPGDPQAASVVALDYSAQNGYDDADVDTTVVTGLDGQPTRLRVTVSSTVDNVFGGLLGISRTTITRTAVADYAGPVPMGSPCNEFGNDPEPIGKAGVVCAGVTGQFWANVGAPQAPKGNGDAFQNAICASGNNGCAGSTNIDYDDRGHFFTMTLPKPVTNLQIEVYDPALVHVGDLCDAASLNNALNALNDYATGEDIRYAKGATSAYCNGDIRFGGSGEVSTEFTVRTPGTNPWDPLSFPVAANCGGTNPQTFAGFNGPLHDALNQYDNQNKPLPKFDPYVASVFRQWVNICTISYAPAGTYMIQVKTNGVGNDAGSGHNRFSLRAFGDGSAADDISLAGYTKMALYANPPSATTEFYLERVPSGAAGQTLNVELFDIGDSSQDGTITLVAPPDAGVSFSNCRGTGVVNGTLSSCSITANRSFNGKWQSIAGGGPYHLLM